MKIIARQDDAYLVQTGPLHGQVIDLASRDVFPPMTLVSLLGHGFWQPYAEQRRDVMELAALYDPSQPRHPAGSPQGGEFAPSGGGGAAGGGATGESSSVSTGGPNSSNPSQSVSEPQRTPEQERALARFNQLKEEYANKNDELREFIAENHPDSPEAQAKLAELKALCKEMHRLDADPGGTVGIGSPGGSRDVVIIGAGPAGLAAALNGGVEGLDALLIDANEEPGGQFKYSSRLENVAGFPGGITGQQLAKRMHDQVATTGADMKFGVRVTGLTHDPETGLKTLTLSNGETITARAVILATGSEFNKLKDVPGADLPGVITGDSIKVSKGARGKTAVILGGSNGAAQAALDAARKSKNVVIISRSPITKGMSDYQVRALRANKKIQIIEDDVADRIEQDGDNLRLTTKKGETINGAGTVGVFHGATPRTSWLPPDFKRVSKDGKHSTTGDGPIHTKENYETDMPGVFAVGEVRHGALSRVGVSVGEGQFTLSYVQNQYLDKQPKTKFRRPTTPTARAAAAKGTMSLDEWDDLLDEAFAADEDQPFWAELGDEEDQQDVNDDDFRDLFDKDQPRAPKGSPDGGQWTSGGGVGGGKGGREERENRAGSVQALDKNGRPIPIKAKSIEQAVELVLDGKVVELPDVKGAATLIDKLAVLAQQAGRDGDRAKNFDLCQVSVRGTNIFCAETVRTEKYPRGIPRLEMPQLGGIPVPGSAADKLPKDDKGKVNGAKAFADHMRSLGVGVEDDAVFASELKASQREMIGTHVAGMINNKNFDPGQEPIFVSSDDYVVDGHHRWAAVVARDAENGVLGEKSMYVQRVAAPITEVLIAATIWSKEFGIKQAAGVAKQDDAMPAKAKKFWQQFNKTGQKPVPRTKARPRAAEGADQIVAMRMAAVADGAEIRAARFQQRDHLVVPVVAIREGVIWPVNAPSQEFVPADVLEVAPQGWNGRPCVMDHPTRGNALISANSPTVLEAESFGQIFNAKMKGDALIVEAWIDPEKAERMGGEALKILQRLRARKPVEVSIGAFVSTTKEDGKYKGKAYASRWTQLVPDHLAFLPEGKRGACSIEMGCGAPRAASERPTMTEQPLNTQGVEQLTLLTNWRAKLSALITNFRGAPVAPNISDEELRHELTRALAADDDGFGAVARVYPADGYVVYVQDSDPSGPTPMQYVRRGYKLASDGSVVLTGAAEQVRQVSRFEPLTPDDDDDGADAPKAAAACGCGHSTTKETVMHRNSERIRALIETPTTPFEAADEAFLAGLSDDRLSAIEQMAHPPNPPTPTTNPGTQQQPTTVTVTTPPAQPQPAPQPAPRGEEQPMAAAEAEAAFLATAPETIREIVAAHKAAEEAKRKALILSLKDKQNVFTDAQLAAMSTGDLDNIAKLIQVEPATVDYSGAGAPRAAAAHSTVVEPPDPWAAALSARKGA